ncbi:MAG: AsmA family protein, partial [Sphingobacteriaceae bacterium]|nr:AsmA family protein [Cytophagaceae bacterium]
MKYFLRFLGILLLLVLLALGFVVVVATTDWGQRFVTKQATNFLAKKLKTPFRIGRIAYRIPDWVLLEDVYFQTPKGDTLLAGQTMRVDLDMLDLVQGKITLNQVELSKIRLYLDRRLPDTTFNFQFLIDAFDTGKPKPVETTAAPLDLSLDAVALNDVRIRYYDDVTGLDTRAYVDTLRAQFGLVDVNRSRYHLDSVFVSGLGVNLRVFKGVEVAETALKPVNPADTLDLQLGTWQLARLRWNVETEEAGFNTNGTIGRLALAAESFSLAKQAVVLRSVELGNSDIAAVLEKRPTKPAAKAAKTAKTPVTDPGWRARVGSLTLANNRLRFDDQAKARQRRGLDYAHLDVKDLNLAARELIYSPERISGQFRGGRFREKSGLVLQRLDADALYSERLISVDKLLLQTGTAGRPGTLLRDGLALRFDSLAQFSQPRFAKKVAVTLRLRQSQLAVADVLDLVPALEANPFFAKNKTAVLRANARISGTLAALNVPQFEVSTGTGTRLNVRGKLTNVTDPERLGLDLTVPELTTTQAELDKFLPKGTLPNTVALPPKFSLTGRLRGSLNALSPDLALRTDWGNASFDGTLKNFVTGKGQAYAGTAVLTDFDAGKWLKNPKQFGKITANATVDGRGLDVKTMDTKFRLALREATLNGYRYQNLDADGMLAG